MGERDQRRNRQSSPRRRPRSTTAETDAVLATSRTNIFIRSQDCCPTQGELDAGRF